MYMLNNANLKLLIRIFLNIRVFFFIISLHLIIVRLLIYENYLCFIRVIYFIFVLIVIFIFLINVNVRIIVIFINLLILYCYLLVFLL